MSKLILYVDEAFISLLVEATNTDRDTVLARLNDEALLVEKKLRDPKRKTGSLRRSFKLSGYNRKLRVSAGLHRWNAEKSGDIVCKFDIYRDYRNHFLSSDILNNVIEKTILGA